jgi:hypothetical protein
MKINRNYRPEICVSTDRPSISAPYLDVEEKRLVSTQGNMMVLIACEIDPKDVSGLIPLEAFRLARKVKTVRERSHRKKIETPISMICRKRAIIINGGQYVVKRPDAFPQYKVVMNTGKHEYSMCLSAQYLIDIAKSIGSMEIRMKFYGDLKAIDIEPFTSNGNTAILMPVRDFK